MDQQAPPRFHFHMIAAEIVFRNKNDEVVNALRINGVLADSNREIPVRLLGKAQQIVQLQFHQRMQDENIEVLDVVLMNFMYLGHMTTEEFNQTPANSQLQEKPTAPPVADLETAVAQAGAQNDAQ